MKFFNDLLWKFVVMKSNIYICFFFKLYVQIIEILLKIYIFTQKVTLVGYRLPQNPNISKTNFILLIQ